MGFYDFNVKGRINGNNLDEIIDILQIFFDDNNATINELVVGGKDGMVTVCKKK